MGFVKYQLYFSSAILGKHQSSQQIINLWKLLIS